MKTRNNNIKEEVANAGSCCAPIDDKKQAQSDVCCEQPQDGTECCDKTATKEVNSKATGCC